MSFSVLVAKGEVSKLGQNEQQGTNVELQRTKMSSGNMGISQLLDKVHKNTEMLEVFTGNHFKVFHDQAPANDKD